MKRRYDPNPDVHEVLLYSGAGEAAIKRRQEEDFARFSAIAHEMCRRTEAEFAAQEREDMRETKRFLTSIAGMVVLVVAACASGVFWAAPVIGCLWFLFLLGGSI